MTMFTITVGRCIVLLVTTTTITLKSSFAFTTSPSLLPHYHDNTKMMLSKSSALPPRPTKGKRSTMKNFDKILQTRRTINSFERNLPNNWEQILQKAIESAIHAPNHKRTEPWKFHLLGPEAIQKVCELNASIVAEAKGSEEAGQKKLKRWLQMPGWLVVTCQTTTTTTTTKNSDIDEGSMDNPSGLEREDYAACCCAVQNLCLSLHNQGMGTKWTTGPVNFDKRFGEIIGLHPKEFVVGTIWFGIPETVPESPPTRRRELKDVLIRHN